jgi:hypothetical protein
MLKLEGAGERPEIAPLPLRSDDHEGRRLGRDRVVVKSLLEDARQSPINEGAIDKEVAIDPQKGEGPILGRVHVTRGQVRMLVTWLPKQGVGERAKRKWRGLNQPQLFLSEHPVRRVPPMLTRRYGSRSQYEGVSHGATITDRLTWSSEQVPAAETAQLKRGRRRTRVGLIENADIRRVTGGASGTCSRRDICQPATKRHALWQRVTPRGGTRLSSTFPYHLTLRRPRRRERALKSAAGRRGRNSRVICSRRDSRQSATKRHALRRRVTLRGGTRPSSTFPYHLTVRRPRRRRRVLKSAAGRRG